MAAMSPLVPVIVAGLVTLAVLTFGYAVACVAARADRRALEAHDWDRWQAELDDDG